MEIVNTNRRKTYRYPINIPGIISLIKNNELSESIQIENISYEGIQIVFSNNNFLIDYFDAYEDNDYKIKIEFEYKEEKYVFETKILWIRMYNLGERNSYILSGLVFVNKEIFENNLLDLLLTIDMQKVYIG